MTDDDANFMDDVHHGIMVGVYKPDEVTRRLIEIAKGQEIEIGILRGAVVHYEERFEAYREKEIAMADVLEAYAAAGLRFTTVRKQHPFEHHHPQEESALRDWHRKKYVVIDTAQTLFGNLGEEPDA